MLEDLRKKTEDLVITVYKLGVASKTIEEVRLEEIEPALAQELGEVDTRIAAISQEIDQLAAGKAPETVTPDIMSKVHKIIDDTDALDSQIMAIPRPRNRIGRPKYYERIRFIIAKIEQMTEKIAGLQERLNVPPQQPDAEDELDDKRPQDGFDDPVLIPK